MHQPRLAIADDDGKTQSLQFGNGSPPATVSAHQDRGAQSPAAQAATAQTDQVASADSASRRARRGTGVGTVMPARLYSVLTFQRNIKIA
jgi:hypothetical protein